MSLFGPLCSANVSILNVEAQAGWRLGDADVNTQFTLEGPGKTQDLGTGNLRGQSRSWTMGFPGES